MHICVILFSGPGDYVHIIKQPVTFGPGTASQQVIAVTVNDVSAEVQEQFTASLSVDKDSYPGITIRSGLATIDIIDNDSEIYISLFVTES